MPRYGYAFSPSRLDPSLALAPTLSEFSSSHRSVAKSCVLQECPSVSRMIFGMFVQVPPDEEETQVTADPRSPSTPGSSVKPDFGFHSLESPQSCMHGEGEEGNEEENLTDDECVDPAPDGCEPEGLAECLQEFEESEVQDQEQELKDEKQETEDEEQDDSGSAGEMLGDDKRRSKAEQESSGTLKVDFALGLIEFAR